jgi:hypothetical protein
LRQGLQRKAFALFFCAKLAVESPPGRPKVYSRFCDQEIIQVMDKLPDITIFSTGILI